MSSLIGNFDQPYASRKPSASDCTVPKADSSQADAGRSHGSKPNKPEASIPPTQQPSTVWSGDSENWGPTYKSQLDPYNKGPSVRCPSSGNTIYVVRFYREARLLLTRSLSCISGVLYSLKLPYLSQTNWNY